MKVIPQPTVFQWDKGNVEKNFQKHNVMPEEAEQIFFDTNKRQYRDVAHSTDQEKRYLLIGKTKNNRLLFIAYTIRGNAIRVISARNLNRREKALYEKAA